MDRDDYLSYEDENAVTLSSCAFCLHKQRGTICQAYSEIPPEFLNATADHVRLRGDEMTPVFFEPRKTFGDLPEAMQSRLNSEGYTPV